ncbi:MAG: hypothetical protein WBD22_03675 [Pyrinomonadaceae bacterium]
MPDEKASDSVKYATEHSTAVFAGKVIGFEYRKGIPTESRRKVEGRQIEYETLVVKFRVERWWKDEGSEVFLITSYTKNSDGTTTISSCDYEFNEGDTYLVYAYGKKGELRTSFCTRTKLLKKADEDLRILGEGKGPVESKYGNEP